MNSSLNLIAQVTQIYINFTSEIFVPVIRHLVHQAVLHRLRRLRVNAVFPTGSKVLRFLDLIRPDALCDSHHPEELVDVVARIAEYSAEDDEDVVDVMLTEDRVGLLFGASHGFTDGCDVSCSTCQEEWSVE